MAAMEVPSSTEVDTPIDISLDVRDTARYTERSHGQYGDPTLEQNPSQIQPPTINWGFPCLKLFIVYRFSIEAFSALAYRLWLVS